jgi:hypothetical protein
LSALIERRYSAPIDTGNVNSVVLNTRLGAIWFQGTCAVLSRGVTEQRTSFPPIVINITDGQATDGDPGAAANGLKDLKTEDGQVLLFNIHVSSTSALPIEFPSDESRLPDDYAKHLFRMSSPLPGYMKTIAREEGIPVGDSPRGFVFIGDMVSVIRFLDIGTRPTSLR